MKVLAHLFENNANWAAEAEQRDPGYFARLAEQQTPTYLWIGCSDSRILANQICGLSSGAMFVHRNVANLVLHTDLNALSVIQYAVHVLRVEHIIVCGHYGCGGVKAALGDLRHGSVIDGWLHNIKQVYSNHLKELAPLNEQEQFDRLCELNVAEQVRNVCTTTLVQDAWKRGQRLSVHGWIYGLSDGLLRDLDLCVTGPEQLDPFYRLRSPQD